MEFYLVFNEEGNEYRLPDDKELPAGQTAFELDPKAYQELGLPVPDPTTVPTIGILLQRGDGYYSITADMVASVAKTGVRVVGLIYEDTANTIVGRCDAVVLPGGSFPSPEEYYEDADPEKVGKPLTPRCQAYIDIIDAAQGHYIPLLGICAGCQMIAARIGGMKMWRQLPLSEVEHNDKEASHSISLEPALVELMKAGTKAIFVNSRHSEGIIPGTGNGCLDVLAMSPDGIVEAVGNLKKDILGVQFHPENLADTIGEMQQIFYWLAQQAQKNFEIFAGL